MRLLLDTHALLWWAHEPSCLSRAAFEAISAGENDVWISAVSAIEIATKVRIGKMEYDTSLAGRFVEEIALRGFKPLSIAGDHAERAGLLPGSHKDPWDRILAAQSIIENLTLITSDSAMSGFGARTLW